MAAFSSNSCFTSSQTKISWSDFVGFWTTKEGEKALNRGLRCLKLLGINIDGINLNVREAGVLDNVSKRQFQQAQSLRVENLHVLQKYVRGLEFPQLISNQRININAVRELTSVLNQFLNGWVPLYLEDERLVQPLTALSDQLQAKIINVYRTFSREAVERVQARVKLVADKLFSPLIRKAENTDQTRRAQQDKATFIEKLTDFETSYSKLALQFFWVRIQEDSADNSPVDLIRKMEEEWDNFNKRVFVHLQRLDNVEIDPEQPWEVSYNRVNRLVKDVFGEISKSHRNSQHPRVPLSVDTSARPSSFYPDLVSPLANTPRTPYANKQKFSAYVDDAILSGKFIVDIQGLEFCPPNDRLNVNRWQTVMSKRKELVGFVSDIIQGVDPYSLSAYAFSESIVHIEAPSAKEKSKFESFLETLDAALLNAAKSTFLFAAQTPPFDDFNSIADRLEGNPDQIKRLQTSLQTLREGSYKRFQFCKDIADLQEAFDFLEKVDAIFNAFYTATVNAPVSLSDAFISNFLKEIKPVLLENAKTPRSINFF
jgi:hypothetical protein